jgi:hypothetical protein
VAEIHCRACSLPLQRYIVDFAAEAPFEAVQAKRLEHHGVEVAISTIRQVTLSHAQGLSERQILPKAARGKATVLIAEEEGNLIPTVQCTAREGAATGTAQDGVEKPDRRRGRKLAWKEARVSLVRRAEAVSPVYAATLGGPEEGECYV